MTKHRFHLPGLAHTVTTADYSNCAFTQKVLKFAKMMRARGHTLIHYGNEASEVDCDEHVTVTTLADLEQSYPGHDWRKSGFPDFKMEDRIWQVFNANTIGEIHRRKQPGDFLLLPFGYGHKPLFDAHRDLLCCENGIGYPSPTFAPYKVFESYSAMNCHYGLPRLQAMFTDSWYDATIPNYFDLADFTFSPKHEDYFLFLGRIGPGKGSDIASDIVRRIGGRLVVAGPGHIELAPHIVQVGVVNPEQRRRLLSGAKATICASTYLEPFCGVQIESMLSGTPVISTDWGAFAEYNLHGVTGYRCRTMEQFTWAARNIEKIDRYACREWAERNFSLERVGAMYEEYFNGVAQVHGGAGWYAERPDRTELDWLRRWMPGDAEPETAMGATGMAA